MVEHRLSTAVRKPAVAGMFYPGEKHKLAREVGALLADVDSSKRVAGHVVGIISPHAGYMYSGSVAAEAFQQIADKTYDIVAVIAPSHREYIAGVSVFTGAAYETPLGAIPIATNLSIQLVSMDDRLIAGEAGHRQEHSLEVQLPFLQTVLSDFELIPIVMGEQDYVTSQMLGAALAKLLAGRNALIVASSDLSHFHSSDEASELDSIIIDHINAFEYRELAEDLRRNRCEACGGGPMISAMIASYALGATQSKVLKYMTSGDIIGDQREVVGYLSAVLYQ